MFLDTLSTKDPAGAPIHGNKKTLLIVDDDPQIRRMLSRMLRGDFKEVLVAATPDEAEQVLSTHNVTHLISDYDLGVGCLLGTELVSIWRKRFCSIERAILITGCRLSETEIPTAVDRYFHKGEDPKNLLEALKL